MREIVGDFSYHAYRRPPGNSVVDRLAAFAELAIEEEGQSFEKGMAKAFTAILASPFFLYRSIDASPGSGDAEYPLIDGSLWPPAYPISFGLRCRTIRC